MKFLAILKDSLRETLDVKLFYAMVLLSLLVSLFVASVVYKPQPIDEQIKGSLTFSPLRPTENVNFDILMRLAPNPETQGIPVMVQMEDLQRTDQGPANQPWVGNYDFTLVLKIPHETGQRGPRMGPQGRNPLEGKNEAEVLAAVRKEITSDFLEETLSRRLSFLKGVKVKTLPATEKDQVDYRVSSEGTTITTAKAWFHQPALFFGLVDVPIPLMTLGDIVTFLGDYVIGGFGAMVTILLSIVMTASFLPNMLSKGSVDLLLVKPINRVSLFVYKFLGGLTFMFLNTVVIMVGIWLGIGVRTGLWVDAFLVCILVYTFQFMIFYSVSAVTAVFTRSAIVAILASFTLWIVLFAVGWTHWIFVEAQRDNTEYSRKWGFVLYDGVKAVLPRYKDLDWLTSRMIRHDLFQLTRSTEEKNKAQEEENTRRFNESLDKTYKGYNWTSSLAVSSVFIALMLGLACWRFSTRDY